MPPNPIKDDYLTQAGVIWKRGEYYENVGGTPPLNWQPASLPLGFKKSGMSAAESSGRLAKMSLASTSAASGTVVRSLSSAQVNPPGPFGVPITVTPQASVTVLVREELLTSGWTAANINFGGLIDTNFNKVKWGPFFLNQSSTPRTYTYQAVPPTGIQGAFALSGQAAFDGTVLNIGGQSQITLGSGLPEQIVKLRAELSDKEIILSWPANAVAFVLEVSDSLASASWTRVPQATAEARGIYSTKLPVAGGSRFYRLRAP